MGKDLDNILKIIIRDNKFIVPIGYKEEFERAFLTFKFQTIFDMKTQKLSYINSMENTIYEKINDYSDKEFLGPY